MFDTPEEAFNEHIILSVSVILDISTAPIVLKPLFYVRYLALFSRIALFVPHTYGPASS